MRTNVLFSQNKFWDSRGSLTIFSVNFCLVCYFLFDKVVHFPYYSFVLHGISHIYSFIQGLASTLKVALAMMEEIKDGWEFYFETDSTASWSFGIFTYLDMNSMLTCLKFLNHTKHVIENGRHFKVAFHKEWKCVSSKGSKSWTFISFNINKITKRLQIPGRKEGREGGFLARGLPWS